jgi:hypothetical protein
MSEENKNLVRMSDANDNTSNSNIVKASDLFIASLKEAEAIADYVINSDTFGVSFEKRVDVLDENGKVILDENGDHVTKLVKNKSDVVAAIMLGKELGIEPMAAITLGKNLNVNAYMKVMEGKRLGLSPAAALSKVHVINTSNGPVVHTGINVISGVIAKSKVKMTFIKDAEPVYGYISYKDKVVVDINTLPEDSYYVVSAASDPNDVGKAVSAKKLLLKKQIVDKVTTIKFERDGFNPITISYSLQKATDAGLYKGISTDGEVVTGKSNWNNHPETILRGRVITIGGRIICGDYLAGIYSTEEVAEFTNYVDLTDTDNPID